MKPQSVYTGREMESMDFAVNYHRWILDIFKPYLGKRIIEVGAGVGAFSEMLLETEPESLVVLEPSTNLFPTLRQRVPRAKAVNSTLRESLDKVGTSDCVLYVNVLEHVEDDEGELKAVHSLLAPGGRICIFVPANRWLMSDMDRLMGHYRRYTLPDLRHKCIAAGFRIRDARHFDILGIGPWFVKYRLMKSTTMESGLVQLYDRVVIPFARTLERLIPPPIGKNLVVIAEK
jgi:2-polyprenyl-3-methyl-5-hydroxy-6-metoxy-1,4-benzoquinol methylase